MPQGHIAELIRMRRIRNDDRLEELDIVVCPIEREAELLEERPDLRDWKRDATKSLDCNVILFLSSSLAPAAFGHSFASVANR